MNARPTVIVVGGGLSGLAVAQRLAAGDGIQVGVVEAGQRSLDDHVYAAESMWDAEKRRQQHGDPTLWRPWDTATAPHYGEATGLRRRLGGRSLCWHGVVVRMNDWALTDPSWPHIPYDEVEKDLADWAGQPLQWSRSATEDTLLDWVRSVGCPGAERTPLAVQRFAAGGQSRWRAYSPLYAGTDAAPAVRDLRSVTLLLGHRCLGVAVTGGRPEVTLLEDSTGRTRVQSADAVVLAAGTIENTRLVAQFLAAQGEAPDGYDGLNDHILHGFTVHVPSAWGARTAEYAHLYAPGDAGHRSNFFVRLLDTRSAPGVLLQAWEVGEQRPSSRNRVLFPCRDEIPWRPTVQSGLTAADRDVIRAQHQRLQQFWDSAARSLGLRACRLSYPDFMTPPHRVGDYSDVAETRPGTPFPYLARLGAMDHEAGTLRYGDLLDRTGRLTAAPSVFVAGPAAFPRSGAANPSLTSLALARHTADHVRAFLTACPAPPP